MVGKAAGPERYGDAWGGRIGPFENVVTQASSSASSRITVGEDDNGIDAEDLAWGDIAGGAEAAAFAADLANEDSATGVVYGGKAGNVERRGFGMGPGIAGRPGVKRVEGSHGSPWREMESGRVTA